jgi:hypothetical protein
VSSGAGVEEEEGGRRLRTQQEVLENVVVLGTVPTITQIRLYVVEDN